MAGDFGKRVVSDNRHLQRLTSSKFVHVDGTTAQPLSVTGGHAVVNVTINTKGVAFIIRSGPRVVASFATTSAEGTYLIGAYCENGLTIDGVSGTGSATVGFD